MLKAMKTFVMLMCVVVCTSCSTNSEVNDVSSNSAESSMNSMLTLMPMYDDGSDIYYAEDEKHLKRITDNDKITLDECNDQELITNVYVNDKYIYYTKQGYDKSNIIYIDKTSPEIKEVLFSVPTESFIETTDGFVYAENDTVYYYDGFETLYSYHDGEVQERLNNITSVIINEDDIYYADLEQTLYRCDKNFANKEKIWDTDAIRNSSDKYLIDWRDRVLSEYSVIKNISVWNEKVMFTVNADNAIGSGLLVCLDRNEFVYAKSLTVSEYQQCGEKLVVYGSKDNRGLYLTDFTKTKSLKTPASKYVYLENGNLYYNPISANSGDIDYMTFQTLNILY